MLGEHKKYISFTSINLAREPCTTSVQVESYRDLIFVESDFLFFYIYLL